MFIEANANLRNECGCIEVITGSMFSGKTEELLRRLKRASYAHQGVALFKHASDKRYSLTDVVTHDEQSFRAIAINNSSEIIPWLKQESVVAIDEAQFFDLELAVVCNQLANSGIRVIVAGLDMDFLGKPFGPIPELLANADFITKLKAICVSCGNLAHFSHRKSSENELIVTGAYNIYEPLCRFCYQKAMK